MVIRLVTRCEAGDQFGIPSLQDDRPIEANQPARLAVASVEAVCVEFCVE
jgi:hypothetical protein